jgi:hypothetical protein
MTGSPRAPATAVLGAVFLLAGLGFDLSAALVCGVALLGLALGAVSMVSGRRSPGRSRSQPPERASSTQSEAAARIARSRSEASPGRGSKATTGRGSPPAISRRSIISPVLATAGQWIRLAGLPSR